MPSIRKKPLSQKGMREIIHRERLIELALEGKSLFGTFVVGKKDLPAGINPLKDGIFMEKRLKIS